MKDHKPGERPAQQKEAEEEEFTFKRATRPRITKKNKLLPGGLDWFIQLDDTLSSSQSSVEKGRETSNFTRRT